MMCSSPNIRMRKSMRIRLARYTGIAGMWEIGNAYKLLENLRGRYYLKTYALTNIKTDLHLLKHKLHLNDS
jgi:hypothetical protein